SGRPAASPLLHPSGLTPSFMSTSGENTVSPDVTPTARTSTFRPARAVTELSAARLLAELERPDDVTDLDVVEVVDGQTALDALADLGCVVLEPLQRRQLGVVDDHRAVSDQSDLRVAPD